MKQRTIAETTSEFYGVDLDEMKSPDQHRRVAWPRNVCMYLAADLKIKKSEIGRFWNRDRTIVYNALKKVGGEIETDKSKLNEVREIVSLLKKRL
tara:strand:- start:505 stop:789 length:285 start_codon:yes stop_codon:yes gene_type:complete